jgi:hypothetical protein
MMSRFIGRWKDADLAQRPRVEEVQQRLATLVGEPLRTPTGSMAGPAFQVLLANYEN